MSPTVTAWKNVRRTHEDIVGTNEREGWWRKGVAVTVEVDVEAQEAHEAHDAVSVFDAADVDAASIAVPEARALVR